MTLEIGALIEWGAVNRFLSGFEHRFTVQFFVNGVRGPHQN